MTPLQQRVLSFVRDHIAEHEYAPSYDDIKLALGMKSKGNVARAIEALVSDGYLLRRRHRARSLEVSGRPDPVTKATVLDDFLARLERKCPAVTSWAMVRQVANEMRAEA
jgi:SOS-response transcriptional repressor LexA